jgi:hypothetical protein
VNSHIGLDRGYDAATFFVGDHLKSNCSLAQNEHDDGWESHNKLRANAWHHLTRIGGSRSFVSVSAPSGRLEFTTMMATSIRTYRTDAEVELKPND